MFFASYPEPWLAITLGARTLMVYPSKPHPRTSEARIQPFLLTWIFDSTFLPYIIQPYDLSKTRRILLGNAHIVGLAFSLSDAYESGGLAGIPRVEATSHARGEFGGRLGNFSKPRVKLCSWVQPSYHLIMMHFPTHPFLHMFF